MNNKKIYAIVGMSGSGKSEVINYLVKKFNWPNIYFGDITFEQMKKENIAINWANERKMREGLRKKYGMGVYAQLSLPKIKKMIKINNVVLIESLYSWSEYKIIKKKFPLEFQVIAVYASPALRFTRLQQRKLRPIKTLKEFTERDWTEIENIEKGGPIAVAEHTIINEGSLKDLQKQIDKIISKSK